jgi:hypothetical protein
MRYEMTKGADKMETKKVEWLSGAGNLVVVEVTLELSKNVNLDGHTIETPSCDLQIVATVDGATRGYGEPVPMDHPVAVAKIGNVGMTKENNDRVLAAISELKSHPAWIAKVEREEKAIQDAIEYEKHQNKMRKVMSY